MCGSHNHNGHNHVVYVNNQHYNGQGHQVKGNAYGHYKNGKKGFDNHDNNQRNSIGDSYTRRDRYYDETRRISSTRDRRERQEEVRPNRTKYVSGKASSRGK